MKIFPFDVVPRGACVAIYGAGYEGKLFVEQLLESKWCHVSFVVDRNYKIKKNFPMKVYSPKKLIRYDEYDYVVIAVSSSKFRKEIEQELHFMGVDEKKIVKDECYFWKNDYENVILLKDERKDNILKIGFLVGRPIGDQIIFMRFYQAIAENTRKAKIYIYSENKEATEAIYYHQPQIEGIYAYCPTQKEMTEDLMMEYDAFFSAAFLPKLRVYNREKIRRIAPRFFFCLEKMFQYQTEFSPDNSVSVFVSRIMLDRAKFMGKNRYTLQDCNGAFNINDNKMEIFLNKDYDDAYRELDLPKQYISFNCGASDVMRDGRRQTKIWPAKYHADLNKILKEKFPNIAIIQIGDKNAVNVENTDVYLFGKPLELIKYVLKNALCHIDCESGMVHLATQLGTKCFVLFGPTPIWFFGYKENTNISPKICGECKGLSKDWYFKCIKYGHAICMESIKPQHVFSYLKPYLKSINIDKGECK